ncbi:hypothetical protein PDO_5149 [Rhizobium sp. PDO1-076]|nr:hypothetical protein PDO_5149 [Rhizobium sp. PDO1-076]
MSRKIQPSGLNRGLPLLLSAEWTPQQAWASFQLLDDLRDVVWNHYAPARAITRR